MPQLPSTLLTDFGKPIEVDLTIDILCDWGIEASDRGFLSLFWRSMMPSNTSDVASASDEVDQLKKELERLQVMNAELKEKLLARQLSSFQMQGELFKYKTYNVGLFNSPWVVRYCTLLGSSLKYYSSEDDIALKPRAVFEVAGSTIEWEGLKQGRYWTFSLMDSAGCCLIRLSSENRVVTEKWIKALEDAGAAPGALSSAAEGGTLDPNGDDQPLPESAEQLMDSGQSAENHGVKGQSSLVKRHTSLDREGSQAGSQSLPEESRIKERQKNKKYSPMVGSTPLHKEKTSSILSSERLDSLPQPGLVNLGAVVLFATNFRLILENMFKYGVLFNPLWWLKEFVWGSLQPLMLCWPILGACALAALGLEIFASRKAKKEVDHRLGMSKKFTSIKRSPSGKPLDQNGEVAAVSVSAEMHKFEWLCAIGHGLICLICLLGPLYCVHVSEGSTVPCFAVTMYTLVVWMKLVSFAHCNYDLRQARLADEIRPGERESTTPIEDADQPLQYPENLTLSNMLYFLAAPTLTYQLTYPRTGRIRLKWLGRRCLELVVMLALLTAIVDQYMFPVVRNSVDSVRDMKSGRWLERVLKLSIPVVYSWLCMFYIVFHVWLNILAEVLRFGDREFYKDWWNATNLGEYWRLWNMPVHKWMLRTIYYPAVNQGMGRNAAMLLVFFVSAVFHEICVAVPLKLTVFFPSAFVGILGQVPMIVISQIIQKRWGDRLGNVFFWVSFCVLGQPICIISYYYDWVKNVAGAS